MFSIQQKDDAAQDVYGLTLTLALLFDEYFIDLLVYENYYKPLKRMRSRQSLHTKKNVKQVVNKQVCLRRFLS